MKPATSIQRVDVCVGKAGVLAGHLSYAKQGQREFSTFAYDTMPGNARTTRTLRR
ncbi:MAG: hypothetical protein ACD_23C00093G0002 [uncultured bacterium]|nr:MAG: hypothetical protein ACD_23C00093G0002 [uncultured bacterium]